MTTNSLNKRLLTLVALCLIGLSLTAQFETDFGLPNENENYWDGIRVNQRRALSLSNTNQNSTTSMLLSRHSLSNGNVLASRNISLADLRLEGRALGMKKNVFGTPNAFFVTGFFRPVGIAGGINRGAFILRTNSGLAPTHFFRRPGDPDHANFTEGVSVENFRNYSFFVGQTSPQIVTGDPALDFYGFWVSKFQANNMGIQWSNRYFLTGDNWDDRVVAKESCLGLYRIGNQPPRAGLAVTGSYGPNDDAALRHAFISMIDRSTGNEIWRTPCPSELRFDEGLDVVYDPSSRRYFMVGYARATDNSIRLYTAAVRDDGVFLGSSLHTPGPAGTFRDMMARAVCLSFNQGHAVVTGYVQVLENGNTVAKTFAAEMTIQPNSTVVWARYYLESAADEVTGRSAESIQPIQGGPLTSGYLIIGGGQLNQAAPNTRDAQALKIRPDGTLGALNCKVIDIALGSFPQQATVPGLQFKTEDYPWVRIPLPKHQRIDLSDSSCAD